MKVICALEVELSLPVPPEVLVAKEEEANRWLDEANNSEGVLRNWCRSII